MTTKNEDDDFKKPINSEEEESEEEVDDGKKKKKAGMFCKPLPPSYFNFIKRERTFWLVLNGVSVLAQVGLAIATYKVVTYTPTADTTTTDGTTDTSTGPTIMIDPFCYTLDIVLYMLMGLHCLNGFTSFLLLVGLDKYVCSSVMMIIFLLINIGILAWAQSSYFSSMKKNCV